MSDTPRAIAEDIVVTYGGSVGLMDAIIDAIMAERERCAKIAEGNSGSFDFQRALSNCDDMSYGANTARSEVALAIRSPAIPNGMEAGSGWKPIDSHPKTGEQFEVLYDNGSIEQDVYWSDTRYCMLGAPMGSRGPGLLSTEAGNLPIDPEDGITHWRHSS